jgi:hypothetical protein
MDFVSKHFAGATLEECHNGYIRYQIPSGAGLSLADCFDLMEVAKAKTGVEDYSVTQTTLEEIFCNFAEAGRADEQLQRERNAADVVAIGGGNASRRRPPGQTTMAVANPLYLQSDETASRASGSHALARLDSGAPSSSTFDEDAYLTIVSPGYSEV